MVSQILIPAVGYCRMSTDQQDTSIDQQKKELVARFGDKYEILEWYVDPGKSGSHNTEKRKDFVRLLAAAKNGTFQVVLCYDLSRFSRLDSIEGAVAKKTLRDAGIKLVTIIEGEIDWTTSTGRIVDSVLSEAQHDYSVRLSNKSLLGKLTAAQKGKLYGQTTPYGLARLVIDSQGNQHVIGRKERFKKPREWTHKFILGAPDEVAVIRWIFDEFRRSDVSFHQLAMKLNERGIKSPNGGVWVYQTVHEILQNVRYAGDLSLGRDGAGEFHRIVDGKVVRNHNKQMRTGQANFILVRGTHDAIIERSVFDEVQQKVKRRWRTGKHSSREDGFPLTGVLYCGHCGKPLYGNDGTTRSKSFKGVRYHCKGIHRSTGCGQWGVKEQEVFPFLVNALIEQIDDAILRQHSVRPSAPEVVDASGLLRTLDKLRADYDAGLQQFLKMSEALPELAGDMADKLRAWKREIGVLEDAIQRHEGSLNDDTDKLKKLVEWRDSIKNKLALTVVKSRAKDDKFLTWPYEFTASTIRELLLKIECRVDLWWERASAKRFRIVRGRLRVGSLNCEFDPSAQFDCPTFPVLSNGAEGNGSASAHFDHPGFPVLSNGAEGNGSASAHFDHPGSLMVWCGARKGLVVSRGWSGARRPRAL